MKPFLFLLLISLSLTPLTAEDLEEAAGSYWTALEAKDKAAAMQYVHPEDLNHFLNRRTAPFRNWTLEDIEELGDDRALVVVSIERFLLNAWLSFRVKQSWVKTGGGWRVRIDPPKSLAQRIADQIERAAPEASLPSGIQVQPERLTFYRRVPEQPAAVRITNGLEEPVRLLDWALDESLFEVTEGVDRIEAGSSARIWIRYRGEERNPNQLTDFRFRLQLPDGVSEFEVPIIYNFENGITRWMRRQSSEKPAEPE